MNVEPFYPDTDASIADAARVSFAKRVDATSTLSKQDKKLIRYLARENHFTPFTHAHLSFRVSAPIFVARQLFRHTVGLSCNEMSRRYVSTSPEFWEPETWRMKAENKKQGSAGKVDEITSRAAFACMHDAYDVAFEVYEQLIDMGICPEQARAVLPQGTYTHWIWTGSLAAWHRVYSLRTAPDAQEETRIVALKIGELCQKAFPAAWEALEEARHED